MDRLCISVAALLGVVSCGQDHISKTMSEVTVRPGDNITLYCDCKLVTGVYVVWYRNCSHESQPSLVLSMVKSSRENYLKNNAYGRPLPRFEFLKNSSSDSYDLRITNITDSDEGIYYCGTEKSKVEDDKYIHQKTFYSYGNATTRVTCDSEKLPHHEPRQDCWLCWALLFALCPVFAVFLSLLSSLVVYQLCQKKAKEPQVDQRRLDTRGQRGLNQDEDVCYAALEIRQASQRPKKKKTQSEDFSTYSSINTSRM